MKAKKYTERIEFRVTKEVREAYTSACAASGADMSKVGRDLVRFAIACRQS